jgi:hypothetical protein
MSEIEILNTVVGGQRIGDMSALSFAGWIAGKINNIYAFSPEAVELTALVTHPPYGNKLADESKISFVRKLLKLNIPLV